MQITDHPNHRRSFLVDLTSVYRNSCLSWHTSLMQSLHESSFHLRVANFIPLTIVGLDTSERSLFLTAIFMKHCKLLKLLFSFWSRKRKASSLCFLYHFFFSLRELNCRRYRLRHFYMPEHVAKNGPSPSLSHRQAFQRRTCCRNRTLHSTIIFLDPCIPSLALPS